MRPLGFSRPFEECLFVRTTSAGSSVESVVQLDQHDVWRRVTTAVSTGGQDGASNRLNDAFNMPH